jgi:predicted DNA-binding WGR domain protein
MAVASFEIVVIATSLSLRRIDSSRNMRRFYRMTIQRDLFGRASLVREWGRIGTRGQSLVESHDDEGEAINSLLRLAAQKQRRGYRL